MGKEATRGPEGGGQGGKQRGENQGSFILALKKKMEKRKRVKSDKYKILKHKQKKDQQRLGTRKLVLSRKFDQGRKRVF